MPASVLTAHVPLVKMDDRKRSGEDLAPPSKRQAVNGKSTSADSDMPWSADLEVSSVVVARHYILLIIQILFPVPFSSYMGSRDG